MAMGGLITPGMAETTQLLSTFSLCLASGDIAATISLDPSLVRMRASIGPRCRISPPTTMDSAI